MTEGRFWGDLERRLADEFAGLPDKALQYYWCDGMLPDTYLLDDPEPRITGKAWIDNGRGQSLWDFTFLLPRRYASREEVDWSALLPPNNVTRWMGFDVQRRRLEIEPAAAVPDLDPQMTGPMRGPRQSP